jgi:acyl-CoA reductase-like NAD-dependent aldehyde dehydrogenase
MSAATQTIESRSPQQPDDVVVEVPAADADAVARAVAAARAAQREWGAQPALARANALTEAAEKLNAAHAEVTELMVREVGKPVTESKQEVTRGVGILRYHAQAALDADGETFPPAPPADRVSLLMSRRRPRGVAGLITPWNFPVAIPLWKAAPALAYGNAVVLKPASDAPAVALRLAELLGEVLPEDVFQVVAGRGGAGEALIELVDVVSFTGSTAVGLSVAQAAAARGVPAQCEMGGLNASIVLPDADVEKAAAPIAAAAMGYAGQKCTATSRVIVVGDPAPMTEVLVAGVEGLATGDPADPSTAVGPVINPPARDEVVEAAAQASREGGRVVAGGEALEGPGLFVAPTVVAGQQPDARLAQEEVFGPICTVLQADSPERAVEICNGVPYGLVTSVFTTDLDAALRAVDGIDTGMIRVNLPTSGVDFHAPFGGEKGSSFGPREQGKAAREHYTSPHTITIGPLG